jgi:hypothetical protein
MILVGAVGFELTTLCSQSRCATRLRYAPKKAAFYRRRLARSIAANTLLHIKNTDDPQRSDENISKLPVTQEDKHNSGIIGDTHIFLCLMDCLQCSDISDI